VKRLGLLLVVALVAACGGNTAAATSTVSTTQETTTTTAEPFPEIEVGTIPAMPEAVLSEEYGGPLTIETACINTDVTSGVAEPDEIRDSLTMALGFAGIDVVDSGCDLTFDIQLDGHRQSARYEVVGLCYGGAVLEGRIVVSAAGQTWQWDVDVDEGPPSQILECEGDAAPPGGPINPYYWQQQLVDPLAALLGPLGEVAFAAAATAQVDLHGELPDAAIYEILTAALHSENPEYRCRAVAVVNTLVQDVRDVESGDSPWPQDPRLLALAPHLIDTYIELTEIDYPGLDGQGGSCEYLLVDALERMTGAYPGHTARIWAEWWLERGEQWLEEQGG
jgi:hypothetical protein